MIKPRHRVEAVWGSPGVTPYVTKPITKPSLYSADICKPVRDSNLGSGGTVASWSRRPECDKAEHELVAPRAHPKTAWEMVSIIPLTRDLVTSSPSTKKGELTLIQDDFILGRICTTLTL